MQSLGQVDRPIATPLHVDLCPFQRQRPETGPQEEDLEQVSIPDGDRRGDDAIALRVDQGEIGHPRRA